MDIISVFVLGLIVVIVFFVGYIGQRIFWEQERLAEKLENMAGIQSINNFSENNKNVEEKSSFKSLAHIIKENLPSKKLKILTLSGATSLLRNDKILLDILQKDVDVDLMLLDPTSNNLFFEEYPNLFTDINSNIKSLRDLYNMEYQGKLSVRLFSQPAFEMLTFIDDEQLFVSSFIPNKTRNLIYEIKSGDKSLYNLYKPMFEFLWERAKPLN